MNTCPESQICPVCGSCMEFSDPNKWNEDDPAYWHCPECAYRPYDGDYSDDDDDEFEDWAES